MREFLQLAQTYKDQDVSFWFMSEKLDGMRAFWDGGVTRGLMEVPFANELTRMATGLWSRYGNAIAAPDWWLDKLPKMPLDGELYLGRGRFQELVSITKRFVSFSDWAPVSYHVFDSPPLHVVLGDGEINNVNFKKVFRGLGNLFPSSAALKFKEVLPLLQGVQNEVVKMALQEQLPQKGFRVREKLEEVIALGGEGLMLRHPTSFWVPKRVKTLLKVKKLLDAEAKVVGYNWAKEGKLRGLMGSVICSFNGKLFELSGFTDEERKLPSAELWEAGCAVPDSINHSKFPRGSWITFTYRELTNDGIPKEARYLRPAHDPL
jgi:DNA ligase-1